MKKTTVIWDFDGTVMNTFDTVIDSWQYAFRTIKGCEGDRKTILETYGEPMIKAVARIFPELPPEESVEIYRSYYGPNFGKEISMFPGVRDVLQALHSKGYKQALVTSRAPRTTYQGLAACEIDGFFDYVVTCDDTEKHKPDPEPVLIAMEKLGVSKEECIMVGDSRFDIDCARNAEITSVLVGWSYLLEIISEEEFGADYIIRKPEELMALLVD